MLQLAWLGAFVGTQTTGCLAARQGKGEGTHDDERDSAKKQGGKKRERGRELIGLN